MDCECELQNTLDVEVTHDALLDIEIGGSAGVLLQAKSVEINANGTSVIAPDDGFDGLKSVEINTNVPKRFECGDAVFNTNGYNGGVFGIQKITKIDVSCLVTSKTESLVSIFNGFSIIKEIVGLESWDTSNVNTMDYSFQKCTNLESIDSIYNWNTSNVKSLIETFYLCTNLQSLDLRGWDTSKVTNMFETFGSCKKLIKLDVSTWNTSNVKDMDYLFSGYPGESLELSGWDASKVTNLSNTIYNCFNLRTIIGDKTLEDVENGTVAMRGAKVNFRIISLYLRFSSILALANGLADLTGATAQTLTIYVNIYNNMYNDDDTIPSADVIAERQARIAAICAAKNWNFAH